MIYGKNPLPKKKKIACKYLFKCGVHGTSCQEIHISQRQVWNNKATAWDVETKAISVQKHTDKIRNRSVISCRQNTKAFLLSQIKMAAG